jgi:hypothetical protein
MNFDHTKPYFNMSLAACRRAGALGGRRSARNRRLCRLTQATASEARRPAPELETAHQASLLLDECFPHLRNAWVRTARQPAA